MASVTTAVQALSISISLVAAGGISTLSIFDVPEIQAQPADRALPATRWLFSRGSHIFPQAAILSAAGFSYLAYTALPSHLRSITHLLKTTNGFKVNGYLAAAILAFSIAPFTTQVMVPNNFALIQKNEQLGGARSSASADAMQQQGVRPGDRTAEDSVYSKGEANEFTDLSVPQTKTTMSSSESDDREVRKMLSEFGRQNLIRAFLLGGGGVVGLLAALA